jgi:hypothetical protein
MHKANDCYKLSEIPEFKDVLLNESNETGSNKKYKKTTYITKNNNKYNIIQYDKEFLSLDLIPSIGLLRSVIIDYNNHVISFSPPKSLPYDVFMKKYPDLKTLNNCGVTSIIAEEFIEGTMMNVFWDKTIGLCGSWEFATRSTVCGDVSFFKSKPNAKTFRQMFTEAAESNNLDFNLLNPAYCYSFVLQHPENRIVVPFKEPQLYLVEVYEIVQTENETVNVFPIDLNLLMTKGMFNNTTVKFPQKYYEWNDYTDLKNKYASMNTDYSILGVVIKNRDTLERCKLRNPVYEYVRNLRGNQPKIQYQYLALRKEGKVGEFLKFYPEYKKDFSYFRDKLHEFTNALYLNYINCYIKKEKPLKEYPEHFRTHMFHIHKRYIDELRPKSMFVTNSEVIKYVNEMPTTLQMYSLNYNMRKRRQDFIAVEETD